RDAQAASLEGPRRRGLHHRWFACDRARAAARRRQAAERRTRDVPSALRELVEGTDLAQHRALCARSYATAEGSVERMDRPLVSAAPARGGARHADQLLRRQRARVT